MRKPGIAAMLLLLSAGTVLAAVSKERLHLERLDLERADLAEAWWEWAGERPPALP